MFFSTVLVVLFWSPGEAYNSKDEERDQILYGTFPKGFLWGSATAAFQIEGGWNASGKGKSIWDELTHMLPSLYHHQNADVACDSYHKYKEDVQILKNFGATAYRFSISWPRILPDGTKANINQDGVDYYNNLIDELKRNGIEPIVTLFHWDLPLAFRSFGGWMNRTMVDLFDDYARVCFETFGAKVKYWITINEPWVIMVRHPIYMLGRPVLQNKTNFARLQFQTMHNLILGHAKVYNTYKKDFEYQNGHVSLSLNSEWCEPKTDSAQDEGAADKCLQFLLGIFAHPIFVNGDYPDVVKNMTAKKSEAQGIRSILPSFTADEAKAVKGSYDFFALNHYTTVLAASKADDPKDFGANVEQSKDPNWPLTGAYRFRKVPWGLRKLLKYIKDNYGNPAVYISENGCVAPNEINKTLPARLKDDFRVDFLRRYTNEVLKAIKLDGVNVKGYMAWTLMDNFEWGEGYTTPFGLHFVNFSDPERTRIPKESAKFLKQLIKDEGFPKPVASRANHYEQTSLVVSLMAPVLLALWVS